ncbi:MAG: DHH family phosphoesterase [bacterium]|nr:DHH family phosphoesterase [bacterium]
MIEKRFEKFKLIVEKMKGKIAIFATAVDPDAIASALALKLIIESINPNITIDIFYGGEIGHPQSRAMFSRNNLSDKLKHASEYPSKASEYQYAALVDSSKTSDERCEGVQDLNPIIVIDHHNESPITETEDSFIWIEPVSATATLMTKLLQKFKINVPTQLRALLALGIHSDTKGMAKADIPSYQAIAWLMNKEGAPSALGDLIEYSLPRSYYIQEKRAYDQTLQRDGWLITNLGFISSNDGDNVATLADKFARQEAVSLVLVYAVIDCRYIRISARSNDVSVPISQILKRFSNSSGVKTVGNGKGEGGARIDISPFLPTLEECNKTEFLDYWKRYIENKVFKN